MLAARTRRMAVWLRSDGIHLACSRCAPPRKVYFDADFKIGGCKIDTYLLEKIRVSTPAPDERNFHAFYQLSVGAPADLRAKLSLLSRPAGYKMLQVWCRLS